MSPVRPVRCSLVLFALGLCAGCAVERSSLSIDSNSRVPFLGLQLAPSKKKEPVYQRSISREPAAKSAAATVQLAVEEPRGDTHWTDWLTPAPRFSQPLPRTEPEPNASASANATASPDEAIEF
uniref:DUF3035 domain-containing protein n=1 Tax=Schlesneria paludicola TaxID=360056 RepID=A0A7C2JYN1_9PLAN